MKFHVSGVSPHGAASVLWGDAAELEPMAKTSQISETFSCFEMAFQLHYVRNVAPPHVERRSGERRDRRKNSRSGRRASDPHGRNWRRVAWLFGAYAAFLSVRSLPASLRRLWRRETVGE